MPRRAGGGGTGHRHSRYSRCVIIIQALEARTRWPRTASSAGHLQLSRFKAAASYKLSAHPHGQSGLLAATSRALPPAGRVSTPVLPLLPPLSVPSMACQFRTLDASRPAAAACLMLALQTSYPQRVGSPTAKHKRNRDTHASSFVSASFGSSAVIVIIVRLLQSRAHPYICSYITLLPSPLSTRCIQRAPASTARRARAGRS